MTTGETRRGGGGDWSLNIFAIRQARLRRGTSGRWVAEQIGIASQQYSRIEHGKRSCSWTEALAIASALGVSIDEIIMRQSVSAS